MHLFDEGETEGQGRFFSPAKIARIRERTVAAEAAQLQHQLTVRDKKLQRAISKAEKARETEERKSQRQSARQIVREQLASEKEERQAIREAQRAKKAIEATKHKREVEERRAQRIRLKEAKEANVRVKKRLLEEDGVDRPRKRMRTSASRTPNTSDSRASSIGPSTRVPKKSTRTISNAEIPTNVVNHGVQSEGLISQVGRSGRAVRLPTRFR